MSLPYDPPPPEEEGKFSPLLLGIAAAIGVTLLFQLGSSLLIYPFRKDFGDGIVRVMLVVAYLLLMIWPTVLIARRQGATGAEFLRARPVSWEVLLAVVVGTLALSQILQSYLLVQEIFLVPPDLADTYQALQRESEQFYIRMLVWKDAGGLILSLLSAAVLPAIGEELLFRGVVQRNFERALGPVSSVALAAFLFAAIHLRPITIVPLFVLGAFLGFAVHRSRSIYPAIIGHFIFNGLAILGLYAPGLDEPGRGAAIHGMEDLVATLPATGIGVVLVLLVIWRLNRESSRI